MGIIYNNAKKVQMFQNSNVIIDGPANVEVPITEYPDDATVALPEVVIGRESRLNALMAEYEELNPFTPIYNKYSHKKLIDKNKTIAIREHWLAGRNTYVANALHELESKVKFMDLPENASKEDVRKARGHYSRGEWLDRFTPEEQQVLATQPKFQPSLWQDFKQSLSSFNPGSNSMLNYINDDNYSSKEKAERIQETIESPVATAATNALGVLAPLEVVSNVGKVIADKALTGGDYSVGDMITGTKHDDLTASLLFDPLNVVGIGEVNKLKKLYKGKQAIKLQTSVDIAKLRNAEARAAEEARKFKLAQDELDKIARIKLEQSRRVALELRNKNLEEAFSKHISDRDNFHTDVFEDVLKDFKIDYDKDLDENISALNALYRDRRLDFYDEIYKKIKFYTPDQRKLKLTGMTSANINSNYYDIFRHDIMSILFEADQTAFMTNSFDDIAKAGHHSMDKIVKLPVLDIPSINKIIEIDNAAVQPLIDNLLGRAKQVSGVDSSTANRLLFTDRKPLSGYLYAKGTEKEAAYLSKFDGGVENIKYAVDKLFDGDATKMIEVRSEEFDFLADPVDFKKHLDEVYARQSKTRDRVEAIIDEFPDLAERAWLEKKPLLDYPPNSYFDNTIEDILNEGKRYKGNKDKIQVAIERSKNSDEIEHLSFLNPFTDNIEKNIREVIEKTSNDSKTYMEVVEKYVKSAKDKVDFRNFIEHNHYYAKIEELVNYLKSEGYIHYDPKNLAIAGERFYSVIGAYSQMGADEILSNLLKSLDANQKLDAPFIIQAFTHKPFNKASMEGRVVDFTQKPNIRIVLNPKSDDILYASANDAMTGTARRPSRIFGPGASFTKYPGSISSVEKDLRTVLKNTGKGSSKYNELGIKVSDNSFRLEYDDDVADYLKQKVDVINAELDRRYGKFELPALSEGTSFNDIPVRKEGMPNIDIHDVIGHFGRSQDEKYLKIVNTNNPEAFESNIKKFKANWNVGRAGGKKIMSVLPIVGTSGAYFSNKKKGGILYKK